MTSGVVWCLSMTLIQNKQLSIYKFTSKQREDVILTTSFCLRVYVSLTFERLVDIKIEIESRLPCIDIYRTITVRNKLTNL